MYSVAWGGLCFLCVFLQPVDDIQLHARGAQGVFTTVGGKELKKTCSGWFLIFLAAAAGCMMDRGMRSRLSSSNIFSNLLSNESNYMLCLTELCLREDVECVYCIYEHVGGTRGFFHEYETTVIARDSLTT